MERQVTKADYDWQKDIIRLRSSYSVSKRIYQFQYYTKSNMLLTLKKMGKKRYEQAYIVAGELAIQKGGDFHDDNQV